MLNEQLDESTIGKEEMEQIGDEIFNELSNEDKVDVVLALVKEELLEALNDWPPFNSAHEGFSVLKEEIDELWDEVKAKQGSRSLKLLEKEAIQVSAMAARFIIDICNHKAVQK